LSGGIDSPVAAYKMMCRGCSVVFVHFHNFGPQSRSVRQKIIDLVRQLTRFQPMSRLYLVPFAKVQADLIAAVPARMRMVAYRRAMLRLATPIVETERAKGFIVGDSVGQVASQTLDNLQATWPATPFPVFAPLIGESKRATTELARRIGTFETSILPYDDCCQLLVARSPDVRCRLAEVTTCEAQLPLDQHFADVQSGIEVIEMRQGET
jgi:thiamine biosynthesis protein ThiI